MLTQLHHQAIAARPRRSFATRFVDYVLAADAGFRAEMHLRQLSPDLLKDMGLAPRPDRAEPPAYDPCLDF